MRLRQENERSRDNNYCARARILFSRDRTDFFNKPEFLVIKSMGFFTIFYKFGPLLNINFLH